MKKHIVGVIVFTLIVGTSVVIAGLFGYSPIINYFSHKSDNIRVYKKKKCKKRRRKKRRRHALKSVKANVSQATFDKRTNELTTGLEFSSDNFQRGRVDLHFFVKDEFGTQYLKKETIRVSSDKIVYKNSFAWLNRLESRKNLYVIAKVRHSRQGFDYQPRFISSQAIPVLLQVAE